MVVLDFYMGCRWSLHGLSSDCLHGLSSDLCMGCCWRLHGWYGRLHGLSSELYMGCPRTSTCVVMGSKMCCICHEKIEALPLSIRQWQCEHCGANHDRDINAAKNIRQQGLMMLKAEGLSVSAS